MTLQAVLTDLSGQWQRLVEELEDDLLWLVMQTKPQTNPEEEHALADHYVDGVHDLTSIAREALEACRPFAQGTPTLAAAAAVLLRCQERYNALIELYDARFTSYSWLRELEQFETSVWREWANQIQKALADCRTTMENVNRGVFRCWQELTDRMGSAGLSVQTTNIGQQITM